MKSSHDMLNPNTKHKAISNMIIPRATSKATNGIYVSDLHFVYAVPVKSPFHHSGSLLYIETIAWSYGTIRRERIIAAAANIVAMRNSIFAIRNFVALMEKLP